jgi:hypothetical protein
MVVSGWRRKILCPWQLAGKFLWFVNQDWQVLWANPQILSLIRKIEQRHLV